MPSSAAAGGAKNQEFRNTTERLDFSFGTKMALAFKDACSDVGAPGPARRGNVARSHMLASRGFHRLLHRKNGKAGVSRFVLGSVSEEVLERSPVPVLLVHQQAGAPTGSRRMVRETAPASKGEDR